MTTTTKPTMSVAIRCVCRNMSDPFYMLRAIALALRVYMLRAIALALRVYMLRAIALALRVYMLRAIALALRVFLFLRIRSRGREEQFASVGIRHVTAIGPFERVIGSL